MGRKTVYLHVGFPKTGSKSIQATLTYNAALLKGMGYLYPHEMVPEKHRAYNMPVIHTIPIRLIFNNDPYKGNNIILGQNKKFVDESKLWAEKELNKIIETNYNIVLSGEGIPHVDKEGLSRFRDYFENNGYEIKVIAFIRSPNSIINSMTQQTIRAGIYVNSKNMDFVTSHLILKLKNIFGDLITYIPFKEACSHTNGPVGTLLKFLDISDQEEFKFRRHNQSDSNLSARINNFINFYEPIIINGKINPNRNPGDVSFIMRLQGNKFTLSKQEVFFEKFAQIQKESERIVELLGSQFVSADLSINSFPDQESEGFYDCSDQALNSFANDLSKANLLIQGLVRKYFEINPFLNNNILIKARHILGIVSNSSKDLEEKSILNEVLRPII